jgi:hypothetical protein
MTLLTVYGDFNCPFSALASVRADVLLASEGFEIDWRAVQHDPAIPAAGETVEGEVATELAGEVATIVDLSDHDVRLHLFVPPVRSNTATACAAFAAAGTDRDRLRRRLFAAVWAEGSNLGDPAVLDRVGASGRDAVTSIRWQTQFQALPRPVTPTLVLPDGYVSRGLGALARLAEFAERASFSPTAGTSEPDSPSPALGV